MMPVHDRIPTYRFPLVTVLLIAANIVVFALQMLVLGTGGENALQQAVYDFVPERHHLAVVHLGVM